MGNCLSDNNNSNKLCCINQIRWNKPRFRAPELLHFLKKRLDKLRSEWNEFGGNVHSHESRGAWSLLSCCELPYAYPKKCDATKNKSAAVNYPRNLSSYPRETLVYEYIISHIFEWQRMVSLYVLFLKEICLNINSNHF